jgi:hypothetical protein
MKDELKPFFFSSGHLLKLSETTRKKYEHAYPFPHAYFDNFLPESLAKELAANFPDFKDPYWIRRSETHRFQQQKLKVHDEEKMPVLIRHVLNQFNSATFLKFLENLTGINGLIGDPYFHGGGMHQIEKGGRLGIHTDFNWNEKLRLDRRVSIILHLNEDWKEEYGGHLEFWNQYVTKCEVKLLPMLNRIVIFTNFDYSWHGHPDPMTCPDGRNRKSLALYYYTNGSYMRHRTKYHPRPGEKIKR